MTSEHKAEPRNAGGLERYRISVGLGTYYCKCGRGIVEVQRPGVSGFGDDAFMWRHLPRKAAK